MTYEQIIYSVNDGVATLTLNRPEARNALTDAMRPELDSVLAELRKEAGKSVKALILTGAAGHFCAGGDVKAQNARSNAAATPRTPMESRQRMRNDHVRIQEFSNLEMPVIAAVDGAAAGAGFSLALAADFILASDKAFFVQSFGRLGLVPDWNSLYLLPRLVGLQRAKELVFTARRVHAREAHAMGFVHSIHPQDQLMNQAQRLARRFTHASTTAIALSKSILNQSFHLDNRAALEMESMSQAIARDTSFHREAVSRFAGKQAALFDWEQLAKEDGFEGRALTDMPGGQP